MSLLGYDSTTCDDAIFGSGAPHGDTYRNASRPSANDACSKNNFPPDKGQCASVIFNAFKRLAVQYRLGRQPVHQNGDDP
jgi:hypothetical protein